MAEFDSKVVLITGAAGGIGLAAAKAFAVEGAQVVMVDLNGDRVAEQARLIRSAGGTATSFQADVAQFSECEAMVAHAVEMYGGLHIAFNNAGIPCKRVENFEDYDIEEWNRVILVNLSAVFYAMKAQVPALKKSGGTTIVNTASVNSLMATPGVAPYVSSKHGVAGLTKASSLDLIRSGIRVNAVCPGIIETPMLAPVISTSEARAATNAAAPIGRIGTSEEIAQVVLFLASSKSSYMVGSLVSADGGLSIS
jgi:NAD(P)-dependent dehydrogenase (short-subunit alcohol dehydrogenase family)